MSHGHYDHFGGMVGFLKANKGNLKKGIPFFVGGEDAFWIRRNPGGQFGALDRSAILDAELTSMSSEGPAIVADHAFTTGRIGKQHSRSRYSPRAKLSAFRWLRLTPRENAGG